MNLAGLRVLVVEDEPILGLALEDMLESLGAEPLLAVRLAEAEERLGDTRVDAAILDVNVHGQRSYGLAARLMADGLPFIFATGYGTAEHPPALARVPTITKPYSAADIRDAFATIG